MKRLLILFVALALSGCAWNIFSYKGRTVTNPENIIQLQQGDNQGIWKTNELAVDYHYKMVNGTLNITGTVNLLGGFKIGFSSIKSLVVHIFLLDKQGVVLDDEILYSTGNFRPIDITPMYFEGTYSVPAGTTAMSFIYDLDLSNGGGGADNGIRN